MPSEYKCDFCSDGAVVACFTCGKRCCKEHSGTGNSTSTLCGECYYLQKYGETYKLCTADNYSVEDISFVEDQELAKMLQLYEQKVRELEGILASASKQTQLLKNKLRLGRKMAEPSEPSLKSLAAAMKQQFESMNEAEKAAFLKQLEEHLK